MAETEFNFSALLAPPPNPDPSAQDMRNDERWIEVDGLLNQKIQIGTEPDVRHVQSPDLDWALIRRQCEALLARHKNLEIALVLNLALLNLAGFKGLAAGLGLIQQLLETQWDVLVPALSKGNPRPRVNFLTKFSEDTDPKLPATTRDQSLYPFGAACRRWPIANTASQGLQAYDRLVVVPPDQRKSLFLDSPQDFILDTWDQINACLAGLDAVAKTMAAKSGTPGTESEARNRMSGLIGLLESIRNLIAAATERDVPVSVTESAKKGADAPAGEKASSGKLAVSSSDDVVRVLKVVCDYYRKYEPSSPVPLLLTRASRLAKLDFWGIVDELIPDSRSSLETIAGKGKQPSESENQQSD
ncbi:MAG: type VI secretion system ImpA family N-terminal domain-containing protein [Verrucomicrobiales bacterium]|nr:type VI secretion system ImpA family N-terminal domain-containing protein [Verrucomicrobiales bacterium]